MRPATRLHECTAARVWARIPCINNNGLLNNLANLSHGLAGIPKATVRTKELNRDITLRDTDNKGAGDRFRRAWHLEGKASALLQLRPVRCGSDAQLREYGIKQ